MSLKHRNRIAWLLILVSALSWSAGLIFFKPATDALPSATTPGAIYETFVSAETSGTAQSASSGLSERGNRTVFIFLCLIAAVTAGFSVFVLYAKTPVLGPDGALLLLAFLSTKLLSPPYYGTFADFLLAFLQVFLLLTSARELWGWVRARCAFGWYLLPRITKRFHKPQTLLLLMGIWIALLTFSLPFALFFHRWLCILFLTGTAAMAVFCLYRYGRQLDHFQQQLDHFQNNQPIAVQKGAMEAAEQQLLEVQAQHHEAVKAAVASERFKVDLISNVSHDLRTPLTAIVGYGELLEKEKLSEEGTVQLNRLNQKAHYMGQLVDSLFELTKVSSGVLECKKEKIDLIRLLEQTLGLMDDQLSMAGLTVKRHYPAQTIPLVTDGSRMHQVFANLLGNAIKYALPGTRIHLEVTETEDSNRIRMVNTASYEMDFDPEEILHRFVRGDKARSTKGSGLGLAIAQTYTQSVGGQFSVTVDGDQFSAIVTLPKLVRNL